MLASILTLLTALLQAIPVIGKWLAKSPTEKVEDKEEDLQEEIDEFKKSGRPKW